VGKFSEKQIALLENFAEQAVIAMENARLISETRDALEQQTATAEVLQVINSSPGNLAPVFETMLEKAMLLCESAFGSLYTYDGQGFRSAAQRGVPAAYAAYRESHPPELLGQGGLQQAVSARRAVQTADMMAERLYLDGNPNVRAMVDLGGIRTVAAVPLCKDETVLGVISIFRQEVRPFSGRQIALLENFAAQAVVAMENARLLTEQREALERQTATAEVLRVINTNPGNLAPVFATILEKAHATCGAQMGSLQIWDGTHVRALATQGYPADVDAMLRRPFLPGTHHLGMIAGDRLSHRIDAALRPNPDNIGEGFRERSGIRTNLHVPLRRDGIVIGFITANRREVRPFSDKEISLLENFAAHAVIAMENARLLNEVRQRQEELRITFENMGDGVAMFDESQHLVAWNGKFQKIFDLPDALLGQHRTYEELLRFLATRGDFGESVETAQQISDLVATTGQPYGYERTRPDGRVIEIRRNPVPDGGFVLIFSDITQRKRSEQQIRAARDAAEAAYRDLKAAQASLIQAEKMASLGQLTAGIAHEIKNPLNFVNNFADLSADLLDELHEALAAHQQAEIDDLTATLKTNLAKIAEHGRRADSIVKNMLLHSRSGPSEHRLTDLNAVVEEALNLAYHGARAEMPGFNITMQKQLDPAVGMVEMFPQEFTRVLLNLISNGFYAARQRTASADGTFEPTLLVATRDFGDQVQIRVRDNGTGISEQTQTRIFEPFFTTKPAGEGTGLGLSLSYDIIVKQHGGQLTVDSRPNEFTEFRIVLPRRLAADEGASA
jgi:PAS domain S-box-containing protein